MSIYDRWAVLVIIVQVLLLGIIYLMVKSEYLPAYFGTDLNVTVLPEVDMNSKLSQLDTLPEKSEDSKLSQSTSTFSLTQPTTFPEEIVNSKLSTFLLIMVSSQPGSFVARETIRDTWYSGFKDGEDVVMRFVVGTKGTKKDIVDRLHEENKKCKDLVIMNFIKDNWITPTNKTLSMILWAHDNVDFTYFMKSDQTTFVHVKNMITELKRRQTTKGLYYGKMQFKKKPIRTGSEWQDKNWDLANTYLPFALGAGYILSSDLIAILAHKGSYLAYHPNEDTAIASWLVAYRYERRDDNLWCNTKLNDKQELEGKCEDFTIAQFCYGIKEEDLRKWFTRLHSQNAKITD